MHRSDRDHYRPVLHLRHFTDSSGLLWAYDRSGTAAPFQQIAPNVGFEKGLYTIVEPPDGDPAEFEAWLATHIDGPAAAVLEKAASAQRLTRAERSILARFIGAQDMRTPRAKERILSIYRAGFDKQWHDWRSEPSELAEAIARDSGTRYTPQEIAELLDEYQVRVNSNAWLDFFQSMVNKAAKRLFDMAWLRGYAPDGTAFITSDVGIVKCAGRPDHFMEWDLGFTEGRDIWVFPVRPDVAVIVAPQEWPGLSGPCRPEWVRTVNEHMHSDAYRWVFSRDEITPG